jgi:hypothetical protein
LLDKECKGHLAKQFTDVFFNQGEEKRSAHMRALGVSLLCRPQRMVLPCRVAQYAPFLVRNPRPHEVRNTDVARCLTANLVVQVPYVDLDNVTRQVLPALVTLGSDPNVEVKHASIDAFGAVAQNFKDDGVSCRPLFESSFAKRWQKTLSLL